MIPFAYRSVSDPLLEELEQILVSGESVLLVGTRTGATDYVMSQLQSRLKRLNIGQVISLDPGAADSIVSSADLSDRLAEATAGHNNRSDSTCPDADCALAPLDCALSSASGRTVMFVPNFDRMAHHVASLFLQGVRTRVTTNDLVVALSGDYDLRHLVHGPNSEFNCTHQYFLQGFDPPTFHRLAQAPEHWPDLAPPSSGVIDDCAAILGGNYTAFKELVSAVRMKGTVGLQDTNAGDCANIATTVFMSRRILPPVRCSFFRDAIDIVNSAPESWPSLEALIECGEAPADRLDPFPSPLEIAGVAKENGSVLGFASPLMNSLVHAYYDKTRFADMYALAGSWNEAIHRYERAGSAAARPSSAADRETVGSVLRSLAAEMYQRTRQSPQEIRRLFALGSRYVLGFRDVMFVRFDGTSHVLAEGFLPERSLQDDIIAATVALPISSATISLPEPLARHGVAMACDEPDNTRLIAFVGDVSTSVVLSREREQLLRELFLHFTNAHGHASASEESRSRLAVRHQLLLIFDKVVGGLGRAGLDFGDIVREATIGLQRLGYRRVWLALVDSRGQRIKGIAETSADSDISIADRVNYPLNPEADVHSWVIATKMPMIVADPLADPRVSPRLNTRLLPFAVVPMLTTSNIPIGTIEIERIDGRVPGAAEVDDVLLFGRLMAVILGHGNRLLLLQDALNKIPEPLLITDSRTMLRYSNRPAAALFSHDPGWRDEDLTAELHDKVLTDSIHASLADSRRIVKTIRGVAGAPEYRAELLCDPIQDWRGETVGILTHLQDQNFLYKIFGALTLVGKATDSRAALEALVAAAQDLGFARVRLYLMDQNQTQLISTLSVGLSEIAKAAFDSGQIRLAKIDPTSTAAWKTLVTSRALVFAQADDQADSSSRRFTRHGVEVVTISPTQAIAQDGTNSLWIEVPLKTSDGRAIGKLVLDCDDDDVLPEQLELLKTLADQVAQLLVAFEEREKRVREKADWIRAGFETSIATVSHNLASRLAFLPPTLARYRLAEASAPQLKAINDQLEQAIDSSLTTISRIKERLAHVMMHPSEFDLGEVSQSLLAVSLGPGRFTVTQAESPLTVVGDRHLLESALAELVQNSLQAVPSAGDLHVTLVLGIADRSAEGDSIRLIYGDNGPGIEEQYKARIFEEFFSHRPGRVSGTGLGLAFVRRVVETHGGSIAEEGEYGKGARFVIRLPRRYELRRT